MAITLVNSDQLREIFINLVDVPHSYSGQAGKIVAVNSEATGLNFINWGWSGNWQGGYILLGLIIIQWMAVRPTGAPGAVPGTTFNWPISFSQSPFAVSCSSEADEQYTAFDINGTYPLSQVDVWCTSGYSAAQVRLIAIGV
jgi:hypothetical protein